MKSLHKKFGECLMEAINEKQVEIKLSKLAANKIVSDNDKEILALKLEASKKSTRMNLVILNL